MNKLMLIGCVLLTTGCTTYVHHVVSDQLPACPSEVVYQVTVDSWCGNGCDHYPISHRAVDPRSGNGRVVLEGSQGSQRPTGCMAQ